MFTLKELIDIAIMTAVIGFIFSGWIKKPRDENYDPLKHYSTGFNWDNFKYAAMAVAPAIILHEFAHKFTALFFGMEAVFNAAYPWLILGVILKLANFPFIFFVPAYVSILGQGTPLQFTLIAFAGPLMNAIIWIASLITLKYKLVSTKYIPLVHLTKQINMFLFIFNMLPIPGFDGSKVFAGLVQAFL